MDKNLHLKFKSSVLKLILQILSDCSDKDINRVDSSFVNRLKQSVINLFRNYLLFYNLGFGGKIRKKKMQSL